MVPQQLHRRRLTLTTASRASRIGRLAGRWTRRRGVAESMARAVAPPDVRPSVQHLHHSIAKPDSPTGSPAGRWPRRPGVAPMLEKAAPYRMAAVLAAVDPPADVVAVPEDARLQRRHD